MAGRGSGLRNAERSFGLDTACVLVGQGSAMSTEDSVDAAMRAANLALSGRKHREVSRLASIELRSVDSRSGPWEAAAMVSVAVFAVLVVCAAWFW